MSLHWDMIEVTATYSNVLQCIAVRCNILQYTATHTEGGITLPWDMIIGHCVTYDHVPFVCVYMNVCHVHTHHSTNISWSMIQIAKLQVDRYMDVIWDVTYIIWAQYSVRDIPCDIVCVYCVCR